MDARNRRQTTVVDPLDASEMGRLLREMAGNLHDSATLAQMASEVLEGKVSEDLVAGMVGLMSELLDLRDSLVGLARTLEKRERT